MVPGLLFALGWWVPQARQAWSVPDEWIFRVFNGTLEHSRSWALLWAWLNTRTFDLVAGVVMGLFFVFPGVCFRGVREVVLAAGEFCGTFLGFSLVRAAVSALVSPRPSPSRHFFPQFVSLEELFPGVGGKVFSDHSFPSDHAAVAFVWALFLLCRSPRRGRFLALPLALFISTPRLVSGAHWMSDVAVGAVFLSLWGFALGYHTPLRLAGHRLAQTLLQRWAKKRSQDCGV